MSEALVDLREIAEMLDVSYGTVRCYATKSPSFPPPVGRAKNGRLQFSRSAVEEWNESRPGRGKGPRPNRAALANPLAILSRLCHAKNQRLTPYDLGRVLNRTAQEVLVLTAHGHIPKGILGWDDGSTGRKAPLVYPCWKIEEWLRRNPRPSLPSIEELQPRNRSTHVDS